MGLPQAKVGTVTKTKSGEAQAIHVTCFGMSDRGQVRKNNEDNFVVGNLTTGEWGSSPVRREQEVGRLGLLFLVADGMGGEASGEVASQLAATTIPRRLYDNLKSRESVSDATVAALLREAIEQANRVIIQMGTSNAACRGMGTTVTAAVLLRQSLIIGQVGDSRCYLLRSGQISQLTRDQTLLNFLRDIGADLPADSGRDSRRSILTQAVGSSESLDVKLTCARVMRGDRMLLCSDGLYNMLAEAELVDKAQAGDDVSQSCQSLVEQANLHGGLDNITVVLAEFSGQGLPPAGVAVECRELTD